MTTTNVPVTNELKGATIAPFDGAREKFRNFIIGIKLSLMLNETLFESKEDQVLWILGYLQEGTAGEWRNNYITKNTPPGGDFTVTDSPQQLIQKLTDVFGFNMDATDSSTSQMEALNAMDALWELKQGSTPMEEFIYEFKLLCGLAHITSETDKIYLFRRVIKRHLLRSILYSENMPTTFDEWVNKAITFDRNHRLATQIRRNISGDSTKATKKNHDNATDVGTMTTDERYALMREGACFYCKQIGHISRDCPKKESSRRSQNNKPWRREPERKRESSPERPEEEHRFSSEEAREFIRNIVWATKEDEEEFFRQFPKLKDNKKASKDF